MEIIEQLKYSIGNYHEK